MTIEDLKSVIQKASGIKPLALLTASGKKIKDLSEVYTSLPLPNYSGLFLASSGVYVWDIYKDKEWRVRIIGPDIKG